MIFRLYLGVNTMWYLHIHFVCDKLCAFCAIFFSFRFTIGLNTFIVSRLEFFCITFDAHPHSGWFICLAPNGARRTNSHIIKRRPVDLLFFHLFRFSSWPARVYQKSKNSWKIFKSFILYFYSSSMLKTLRKASCGTSTDPIAFMRFLPAFCFSRSLRLRETSPP